MAEIPDPKNEHVYRLVERLIATQLGSNGPHLFGISGAGGAGKTTFAQNLIKYLGEDRSLAIDLDDYLLSRDARGKLGLTGYNPRANKLSLARSQLESLKANQTIKKPRYDHSTGKVLPNEEVSPKGIIVIEGVTTFYPELRELYDLSFFLDATDETQIKSRITRDVNERGYTLEEALALLEAVKPDYLRFIEPTKDVADVVFNVNTDYVMTPTHIREDFR